MAKELFVREKIMKTLRSWLSAGLICMGIASCASMSQKECKVADWRELGLTDGLAGKTLTFFNERRTACAEADVAADTTSYLAGREQGLKTYCQLPNAAQAGLRGEAYGGVCPPAIDREFRRRHQIGFDIFQFRAAIVRQENHLQSLEHRLNREAREYEKQLASNRNKNEDQVRRFRDFQNSQHRIRDEQRETARALNYTRDQLRNAEAALTQLR